MKTLATWCMISVSLGGLGCSPWEPANPGVGHLCVGQEEVLELDQDLGGYTVESHAAARSGDALVESDGFVELRITTTALGPVQGLRGWDCSDRVSYDTPVEVHLRTDDGRIDLVLDGTLDTMLGGSPHLDVQDVPIEAVEGLLGLEQTVGATDRVVAVRFDLAGQGGIGSIEWVLAAQGRTIHAATLHLPWNVEDTGL
jgi:hypothetical protein